MITYKNIEPTKIANNLSSSFAIHPGELIKDEIDSRNITQKQLAEKMNVSYTVLNEVLNGKSSCKYRICHSIAGSFGDRCQDLAPSSNRI